MKSKLEKVIIKQLISSFENGDFDNYDKFYVESDVLTLCNEKIYTTNIVSYFFNTILDISKSTDEFIKKYLLDYVSCNPINFANIIINYEKRNGIALGFEYYEDILLYDIIQTIFADVKNGDVLTIDEIYNNIRNY